MKKFAVQNIRLKNLGTVNQNCVEIDCSNGKSFVLYFSYETIVGFDYQGKRYVSENIWSKTMGKMLNWLSPNKKDRLPNEKFKSLLNEFKLIPLLNLK